MRDQLVQELEIMLRRIEMPDAEPLVVLRDATALLGGLAARAGMPVTDYRALRQHALGLATHLIAAAERWEKLVVVGHLQAMEQRLLEQRLRLPVGSRVVGPPTDTRPPDVGDPWSGVDLGVPGAEQSVAVPAVQTPSGPRVVDTSIEVPKLVDAPPPPPPVRVMPSEQFPRKHLPPARPMAQRISAPRPTPPPAPAPVSIVYALICPAGKRGIMGPTQDLEMLLNAPKSDLERLGVGSGELLIVGDDPARPGETKVYYRGGPGRWVGAGENDLF